MYASNGEPTEKTPQMAATADIYPSMSLAMEARTCGISRFQDQEPDQADRPCRSTKAGGSVLNGAAG